MRSGGGRSACQGEESKSWLSSQVLLISLPVSMDDGQLSM